MLSMHAKTQTKHKIINETPECSTLLYHELFGSQVLLTLLAAYKRKETGRQVIRVVFRNARLVSMLAKSSWLFRHNAHDDSDHHSKLVPNCILVPRVREKRHCAVWVPPPNLLAQSLAVEVRGHMGKELIDSVLGARRVAA
jgi:hypothetical protein